MAPGFLYIVAAVSAFAQVPEIGAVRETEGPRITPPQVVTAATNRPPVRARAEWDSKPPAAPKGPIPNRTRIAIHHTGNALDEAVFAIPANAPESLTTAIARLNFELGVHRKQMGWTDIAYHYIVDWEGRIWEGRPQAGPGLSVAVLGNWGRRPRSAQEADSRKKQAEGLENLLIWLSAEHRIRPASILSHRDYEETTCPGDFLTAPVRDARARIRAL
ncbi:MAG: N-acetylmuramoyl-L-alanine amidase, partial [Elusimicrobia bacterium]|nr:N-acetylmuramoyl-L-alanine amidase [Elusimicrobiota bacterium]